MKKKIYPSKRPIFGGRMRTASIVALGLLAGGAYAQHSSNSDSLQNGSSATDPSRNGSYDSSTSPGSPASSDNMASDRSNSSGYSSRRSTNDDSGLKHGDKRFITKAAESSQREIALSQLAATRATNPQVRGYAQQLVSGHQQMDQELVQLAQQKGVTLDDVAALSTSNVSGSTNHSTTGSSGTANAGTATDNRSANQSAGTHASNGSASDSAMASSNRTTAGSTTVADNNEATSDRHYRSLAKKSGAEFDREYVEMMIKEHKSAMKLFQKAANDSEDNDIRSFASRQLPSLQANLDQANGLGQIAAE
jgi:predicted outer membrane protein